MDGNKIINKGMKKTVSVVICAYNEEKTVGLVLKKVRQLEFVDEIIIVDNGSMDNTYQVILDAKENDARVKVIQVTKNKGLGYGLKSAIQNTTGDIVVRQDADLEYDPFELYSLVEQIENGNADVVYGSRMLVRKTHKVHYFYNYLANRVLSFLNNMVTNLFLSDIETAAKAFNGKILRSINIVSNGFEIENELTIKLKKIKCTFYEVPISYYGRTFEEGKKIRAWDGFKALYYIFFYKISSCFMKIPKTSTHTLSFKNENN
ncbi:MAG: glycosyl transferase [Candidatus Moranbacteria bacterium CG23_combo_of_CG06-09_8_20_14_all_39_10]|nr:MAG: glycosyl transferase [Candidatus Moranbacteria bacterium CG23_combo_of_CG06-09_8_20_14_all_39_10]